MALCCHTWSANRYKIKARDMGTQWMMSSKESMILLAFILYLLADQVWQHKAIRWCCRTACIACLLHYRDTPEYTSKKRLFFQIPHGEELTLRESHPSLICAKLWDQCRTNCLLQHKAFTCWRTNGSTWFVRQASKISQLTSNVLVERHKRGTGSFFEHTAQNNAWSD